MVPGEQHRLEKDRKDAEKCGFPRRSPPNSADPKSCGHAHRHVNLPSPQYHARSLILFDYVNDMLSYNGHTLEIQTFKLS
jgi:hypothetical protein